MNKTVTKIMSKKLLAVLLVLMVALIGTAFYQKKPWVAPASADAKKSPLHNEAVQIAEGKKIYEKECQSCHGKKGKGDGPSAKDLDIPAGNFTKPETQGQSDGALDWKTAEGRKPMPSFKKKLNEDQIWHVIAYMRTFK